jgi:hypothetical protein
MFSDYRKSQMKTISTLGIELCDDSRAVIAQAINQYGSPDMPAHKDAIGDFYVGYAVECVAEACEAVGYKYLTQSTLATLKKFQ